MLTGLREREEINSLDNFGDVINERPRCRITCSMQIIVFNFDKQDGGRIANTTIATFLLINTNFMSICKMSVH